nr:MAG TPA: hypothetical protein [Caudoviricetes sp.]
MDVLGVFKEYAEWFGGDFTYNTNSMKGDRYIWRIRVRMSTFIEVITYGNRFKDRYPEKKTCTFEIKVINIMKDGERTGKIIEKEYTGVPYYLAIELIRAYHNS